MSPAEKLAVLKGLVRQAYALKAAGIQASLPDRAALYVAVQVCYTCTHGYIT